MTGPHPPINDWLETVGALAGVPIELGHEGSAEIELASGGTVLLEFDQEAELLLLSADLFNPPDSEHASVLEHAMRLNLLGLGTRGATLGWDAERGMLVLSASSPTGLLDEPTFLGLLSGFIETVQDFRTGLPGADDATAVRNAAVPPPFLIRG